MEYVVVGLFGLIVTFFGMSGVVYADETTSLSTISGRVTNENGEPIPNVYVNVGRNSSVDWPTLTQVTDDDGRYAILVSAGIYTLYFEDSSGAHYSTSYPEDIPIYGLDVSGIDVVMESDSTLSGTIVFDENIENVERIYVDLFERGDDMTWRQRRSTSSENGMTWQLRRVPAGTYRICVSGYSVDFGVSLSSEMDSCYGGVHDIDEAADIVVGENETIDGIVLTIKPYTHHITGTVTAEDGLPLSGIQVRARTTVPSDYSYTTHETTTTADGQYSLVADADTYTLWFTHPDNRYETISTTVTVEDSHVNNVDGMMIENYGIAGSLQISTTEKITGDVRAYRVDEETGDLLGTVGYATASIEDGFFLDLDPGVYRVCAYNRDLERDVPLTGCYGEEIRPTEGANIVVVTGTNTMDINIDFAEMPYGTIEGIVTNNEGEPLENIRVSASVGYTTTLLGKWSWWTMTDERGAYQLNVVDGNHGVGFSDPAKTYINESHDNIPILSSETSDPVPIAPNEMVRIDASLDMGGQLRGTVSVSGIGRIDSDTTAAHDAAEVQLAILPKSVGIYFFSSPILPDGSYSINGIPTGIYKVCYSFSGYAGLDDSTIPKHHHDFSERDCYDNVEEPADGVDVMIAAGDTVTLDIVDEVALLTRLAAEPSTTGAITGVVRDESGTPLPNVKVSLYKDYFSPLTYTFTDEDGMYAFGRLFDNPYYIRVDDPAGQYVRAYYQNIIQGGDSVLVIEGGNTFNDVDIELAIVEPTNVLAITLTQFQNIRTQSALLWITIILGGVTWLMTTRGVKRNRLALAGDEKADLEQLVQMSDDEIDLSDVPEITAEQMSRAIKRINGHFTGEL